MLLQTGPFAETGRREADRRLLDRVAVRRGLDRLVVASKLGVFGDALKPGGTLDVLAATLRFEVRCLGHASWLPPGAGHGKGVLTSRHARRAPRVGPGAGVCLRIS
jgi:hypothetical protein